MGLWPFGRKKDDKSVEALLAEANARQPDRSGDRRGRATWRSRPATAPSGCRSRTSSPSRAAAPS